MLVSEILRRKGPEVVTIVPDSSISDLVALLTKHRIGATVVSRDGQHVEGIISERDVVRALAERGQAVLGETVGAIMTGDVRTCGLHTRIDELMALMTEHRVRHVPVLADGVLRGIVSIGDVVKSRMVELELERDSLAGYISSAG